MCIPLIKGALGDWWAIGFLPDGQVTQTRVSSPLITGPATSHINSTSFTWNLTTDSLGRLVKTKVGADAQAPTQLVGVDILGQGHGLTVSDSGATVTVYAIAPVRETVPAQKDISLSSWPVSAGVVCTTCGNASVNVQADFGCWCCTCNRFVDPDDTTLVIVLDE